VTRAGSRIFPAATRERVDHPRISGVGYIIGPRIAGVLVSGGVLAWLGIIPLIASLVPNCDHRHAAGAAGLPQRSGEAGKLWMEPRDTHVRGADRAIYYAYVGRSRRAGGRGRIHHLLKERCRPSCRASKGSLASLRGGAGAASAKRTEQDLPLGVTAARRSRWWESWLCCPPTREFRRPPPVGVLIVVSGSLVTVASRTRRPDVGTSSNPVPA